MIYPDLGYEIRTQEPTELAFPAYSHHCRTLAYYFLNLAYNAASTSADIKPAHPIVHLFAQHDII